MSNHIDRVLLKIKRKYTTDEEIGIVIQKLKEIEFENGQLKAEISELKYQLSQRDKKDEQIISFKSEIKRLNNNILNLTDDSKTLEIISDLKTKNKKLDKLNNELIGFKYLYNKLKNE